MFTIYQVKRFIVSSDSSLSGLDDKDFKLKLENGIVLNVEFGRFLRADKSITDAVMAGEPVPVHVIPYRRRLSFASARPAEPAVVPLAAATAATRKTIAVRKGVKPREETVAEVPDGKNDLERKRRVDEIMRRVQLRKKQQQEEREALSGQKEHVNLEVAAKEREASYVKRMSGEPDAQAIREEREAVERLMDSPPLENIPRKPSYDAPVPVQVSSTFEEYEEASLPLPPTPSAPKRTIPNRPPPSRPTPVVTIETTDVAPVQASPATSNSFMDLIRKERKRNDETGFRKARPSSSEPRDGRERIGSRERKEEVRSGSLRSRSGSTLMGNISVRHSRPGSASADCTSRFRLDEAGRRGSISHASGAVAAAKAAVASASSDSSPLHDDETPVKLLLPGNKVCLVRYRMGTTASEMLVNNALRLHPFLGKFEWANFVLQHDGTPVDAQTVLSDMEGVQHCIETFTLPVFELIAQDAIDLHDSGNPDEELDDVPEEDFLRTTQEQFPILVTLPNGRWTLVQASSSDTVVSFRTKTYETARAELFLPLPSEYQTLPGVYDGTVQLDANDTDAMRCLMDIDCVAKARVNSTTPCLRVMPSLRFDGGGYQVPSLSRQRDDLTRSQKRSNVEIGALIGRPLQWTAGSDEAEIAQFRDRMERLVAAEQINTSHRQLHYTIRADASAPPLRLESEKFLMTLTLPLYKETVGSEVRKTVNALLSESATSFLERVFRQHYARILGSERHCQEFILKVTGIAEYIHGDLPLSSFQYIRTCVTRKVKPALTLEDRPKDFDARNSSVGERPEEFRTLRRRSSSATLTSAMTAAAVGSTQGEANAARYSHEELSINYRRWDHLAYASVWDIQRKFRVRIVSVDNLGSVENWKSLCSKSVTDLDDASITLHVTAAVYHGGCPLTPPMSTPTTISSASPQWDAWLTAHLEMMNLPRAARICFTVWARKIKNVDDDSKDVPLAWVNMQLFDFKHELRTGTRALKMWPDEAANPIGTCVANNVSVQPPCLFVEFDSYALPVVFPTVTDLDEEEEESYEHGMPSNRRALAPVEEIFTKDPLYAMSVADAKLVWQYRHYCKRTPHSLPKVLLAAPPASHSAAMETYRLLTQWEKLQPQQALELLDARHADTHVRSFAIQCLEDMKDDELMLFLLQLTQALKYEPYHDSALARFLVRRAVRSRRVGHAFFWYLKGEIHVSTISERFCLLLEAYLRGCGEYRRELANEDALIRQLVNIGQKIKSIRSNDQLDEMMNMLKRIRFPTKLTLPLSTAFEVKGLQLTKCRLMSSKMVPIWLNFKNADPHGSPIMVMLKCGDDLRQDALVLQILTLMDRIWRSEGMDMKMTPYGAVATGDQVGMIEIVQNASTTSDITTKHAGALGGIYKDDAIAKYLRANNPSEAEYKVAVDTFTRSCAGYCVATFVLGIGDRHSDNVMVTKSGRFLHIDFGHFLGNFKTFKGIWKRERTPFKFTADMAFVMGGRPSAGFNHFVELCGNAFNVIRKHSTMFINLFSLMLSTGIPELQTAEDIAYLREALLLDKTDEQAAEKFSALIIQALSSFSRKLDDAAHNYKHKKKK